MIIAARTLIVPVHEKGWARPFLTGIGITPDRNFSYPGGQPGVISGIANEVMSGCDITPYAPLVGVGGGDLANCVTLRAYAPPTSVRVEIPVYVGAGNIPGVGNRILTHDAVLMLQDGTRHNPWTTNTWFGTFFYIETYTVSITATYLKIRIEYKTQRAMSIAIASYEGGSSGIITNSISGASFPVMAIRLSDNTQQVIANGGITVQGEGEIYLDATCAGAWVTGDVIANIECRPEIPYGL